MNRYELSGISVYLLGLAFFIYAHSFVITPDYARLITYCNVGLVILIYLNEQNKLKPLVNSPVVEQSREYPLRQEKQDAAADFIRRLEEKRKILK